MRIKLLKTTDKKKKQLEKRHIAFQGTNKGKIRVSAVFSKKKRKEKQWTPENNGVIICKMLK